VRLGHGGGTLAVYVTHGHKVCIVALGDRLGVVRPHVPGADKGESHTFGHAESPSISVSVRIGRVRALHARRFESGTRPPDGSLNQLLGNGTLRAASGSNERARRKLTK